MVGFWRRAYYFFGMAFNIAIDPYRVANPKSRTYIGFGASNSSSATPMIHGTHRRLAMKLWMI